MKMKYYKLQCLVTVLVYMFSIIGSVANSAEIVTYYHTDGQGSVVAATNDAGDILWKEAYMPFGDRIIRSATENTNWYTGHAEDKETGLTYMGARWYDPVLGQFLGYDPAGVNPDNHFSFNRYAYANNNPYTYVDKDGELAILTAIAIVALVNVAVLALEVHDNNTNKCGDCVRSSAGIDISAIGGLFKGGEKLTRNLFKKNIADVKSAQNVKRGKGVSNPEVGKLTKPPTPGDMSLSQFGKNVIGWGKRPQGALDQLKNINPASVNKMKEQGLTKEMAIKWRDFYKNEYARNSNNTTAINRVYLMDKIIDNF